MPRKKVTKKWSPEQLAKFRATMAAKTAAAKKLVTGSVPLSVLPERPAPKPAAPVKKALSPRLQLLADVVRLLLAVLEGEK